MTWKRYEPSAETAGSEPESKSSAEESPPTEGPGVDALPADRIPQLQGELEVAKTEIEQLRDRFLRKAAELENFRKRTEKEKTESVVLAKSSVLAEFLPVVDACELALESFRDVEGADKDLGQYREGVQLLYKQLRDTLSRVGVVPIEARGRAFDPRFHEALVRENTTECDENTVTKELRRGYLFKDRLLRPAQVAVASRPEGDNSTES